MEWAEKVPVEFDLKLYEKDKGHSAEVQVLRNVPCLVSLLSGSPAGAASLNEGPVDLRLAATEVKRRNERKESVYSNDCRSGLICEGKCSFTALGITGIMNDCEEYCHE